MDELLCGCRWYRDPGFGDVLGQCDLHRAGASYEGGQGDAVELVGLLRDAGLDAELLYDPGDGRGQDS